MKLKKIYILTYIKYAIVAVAVITLALLLIIQYGHRHSFDEWQLIKEPTCQSQGLRARYCSCGERQTIYLQALGHTPSDEWTVNGDNSARELCCSRCGEVLKSEKIENGASDGTGSGGNSQHTHLWSSWNIIKPASCTENGLRARTCACGAQDNEIIQKLEHTFGDWKITREATCTDPGMMTRVCSCGESEASSISPLGHTEGDFRVEKDKKVYYCSRCHTILRTEEPEISDGLEIVNGCVMGIGTCTAKDIIIPSTHNGVSVTEIADNAFEKKCNITSVTLPSSIKTIGESAFYGCQSLQSINLENVEIIGGNAFGHCRSLACVSLGSCISEIGTWAFRYCTSLQVVLFDGTQEDWNAVTCGKDWLEGTLCPTPTVK